MRISNRHWLSPLRSLARLCWSENNRHAQARRKGGVALTLEALEDRIVLSGVVPFPLVTATNSSLTQLYGINVTQADIERWAPTLHFHSAEQYFPASVDYLLQHSTLLQRDSNFLPPNPVTKFMDEIPTTIIKNAPVTQQDLLDTVGTDPNLNDSYFLSINPVAWPGNDGFGRPNASNPLVAPQYVNVVPAADGSYVDLNYFSVYAYNGPQTAGFDASFHSDFSGLFPVDLNESLHVQVYPFAIHQGDIDTFVTMRLTPDLNEVLYVRLEGHGDASFYLPHEMRWEGTHAVVAVALNSHASLNPADPSWVNGRSVLKGVLPANGIVSGSVDLGVGTIHYRASFTGGFQEYFDLSGYIWRPGVATANTSPRVVLVGAKDGPGGTQVPINDQIWTTFGGRWGASAKVNVGAAALQSHGGASSTSLLNWLDTISTSVNASVKAATFGFYSLNLDIKQKVVDLITSKLAGSDGDTPANPNGKLHEDGPHLPNFTDHQSPKRYIKTGTFQIVSASDPNSVLTAPFLPTGTHIANPQLNEPLYPGFQTWTFQQLPRGVDDGEYTVYALYNETTQTFLVGQNLMHAPTALGINPETLGTVSGVLEYVTPFGTQMTWNLSDAAAISDPARALSLRDRNGYQLSVAGHTRWKLVPVKVADLNPSSSESAPFLELRNTEVTGHGTTGHAEFGQPGFIQGLVRPSGRIGYDLSFEYLGVSPWTFGKYEGATSIPKVDYERRDSDQISKARKVQQSASLTGYGSMSQSIYFNGKSTSYVIKALLAAGPIAQQRVVVLVDNVEVGVLERTGTNFGEVITRSFKATPGFHKVTFQGVPLYSFEASALIDNIQILALPNMIDDPGFQENPYRVTSWKFHGQLPPGDGAYVIPPLFEGENIVAGLGYTGSISQPVSFPTAGTYRLSFYAAYTNRNPSDPTIPEAPLRVTLGGSNIGDAFAITKDFRAHAVEFRVSTPGTYDIEFGHRTGINSSVNVALFIDNIFLTLVSQGPVASTQGFASGVAEDVWKYPSGMVSVTDGVDTIEVPVAQSVAIGHGVFKIPIPENHPFLSAIGEKNLVVTYHGDGRDFGSAAAYRLVVSDMTAPTFSPPLANKSVEATGQDGAVVTFEATATDTVDATPTVDCDISSGSIFPIGTTTVTCTATDDANNSVSESFEVTVVGDQVGPTIRGISLLPDAKGKKILGLMLTFSEPLARSGAESLGNYSLEARARRRSKPIPLSSAFYNTGTVTITLAKPISAKKLTSVFLTASGGATLTDASTSRNQLDGDFDGIPGGDFIRHLSQSAILSMVDELLSSGKLARGGSNS